MMFWLLLATVASCTGTGCSCTFGGIDQNGWINLNVLLVLVILLIGAFVWSISTLFPASMGEKLRGASKYEMINGLLGLIIIGILVSFAAATCQVGSQMVSQATGYQNPLEYSAVYVGQLLFQRSTAIFSQIYSESLALLFWGNIMDEIESIVSSVITSFVSVQPGFNIVNVFFGFSGVLTATYSGLIAITFGVLFVVYLIILMTGAVALTVIVPVALILRSIPFAGPRLRETSDTFLAIAIAFYFILPLTILLNYGLMNWLSFPNSLLSGKGCTPGVSPNPNCEYLQQFNVNLPVDSLFTQKTIQLGGPLNLNVPISFLGGGIAGQGGIFSAVTQGFATLTKLPSVIITYGEELSIYLFQSIVLIALDLGITVAFAQGLTKALGSVSRLVSAGPVWGNQ